MTMLNLVSGANSEGYSHALNEIFTLQLKADPPCKTAFCKARQKVSFEFFHDAFSGMLGSFEGKRVTFNGLRIYAVDGQELVLPRKYDIVAHGFNGRTVTNGYS